jgi:hypothetical protein
MCKEEVWENRKIGFQVRKWTRERVEREREKVLEG